MCDSFLTLVRGVTVIIAIADYRLLLQGAWRGESDY